MIQEVFAWKVDSIHEAVQLAMTGVDLCRTL